MPRRPDVLQDVRRVGQRALSLLQDAIRTAEAELESLRAQAERWRAVLGGGAPTRTRGRGTSSIAGAGRVNWNEVLAALPREFSISDVMSNPAAAAKARAQVYAGISRWEMAKLVKRVGTGRYQKTSATKAMSPSKGRAPGRRTGKTRSASRRTAARAKKGARPKPPPVPEPLLQKLPRTFTLEDLGNASPQIAENPRRAYLQVARWSRSRRIKKVGQGRYQRL